MAEQLPGLILTLLAFVLAIDVHEFSHALIARREGDVTAQQLGRLSLNPLRHLDPLGSVLLLIMVTAGFGIGWGKPVPVNPANLRRGRHSMALVSVAGVVANLLTAMGCGLLLRWTTQQVAGDALGRGLQQFLITLAVISVGLAVFNLIPLAPLDGFNIVVNVLPSGAGTALARYAHWGPGILMLLIFLPQLIPGLRNINPLAVVLGPPRDFLLRLILGT